MASDERDGAVEEGAGAVDVDAVASAGARRRGQPAGRIGDGAAPLSEHGRSPLRQQFAPGEFDRLLAAVRQHGVDWDALAAESRATAETILWPIAVAGYSQAELAKHLGMSEGEVKARIDRLRADVFEQLSSHSD